MEAAEQDIWEAYLNNTLPEAERIRCQEQLAADPELANRVASLRQELINLETVLRHTEKEQLKELYEAAIEAEIRPLWPRILPFVSAAAVIAILIFTLFFPRQFANPQKLADRQWEAYDLVNVRSGASAADETQAALQRYQSGQYAEAILALEAIPDSLQRPDLRLALGLSQYQTDQLAASIQTLATIQDDPLFGEAAQWYLALSHLKNEEINQARTGLQNIADNSRHYKQTAAEELLEMLPKE